MDIHGPRDDLSSLMPADLLRELAAAWLVAGAVFAALLLA
jgi:hypothetical protein